MGLSPRKASLMIAATDLILGVLVAIAANCGTRPVVALVAGGWTSEWCAGAAPASGLVGMGLVALMLGHRYPIDLSQRPQQVA